MSNPFIPDWATHYDIVMPVESHKYIEINFYTSGGAGRDEISNLHKILAPSGGSITRIDVIAQNGNDGLHYADAPLPKQDRYKNSPEDEEDYIDKTYRSMPWKEFLGAIKWTIGKYFDRFGKKDDILKEAIKIEDYAIRFRQKVELEVAKRNKQLF